MHTRGKHLAWEALEKGSVPGDLGGEEAIHLHAPRGAEQRRARPVATHAQRTRRGWAPPGDGR